MFGRSTASFDRQIEKATSQLLLEPDWDSILQICDSIRQGDVTPRNAIVAIKKKISHENPHVCMFALQVLESTVKNCGSIMHSEVTTKEFMEFLKDLVKVRPDPVKTKILELIQCWSHAFRNEGSYKAVQDTFQLMKMEGYTFPVMKEADAMFAAEKAPEWRDGECCHRCRVQFTMVQRKHHCRNCGQVFCHKCSSRNSIIPKFGIEREVRVCEDCFEQLNKAAVKKSGEDELPAEYLASPLSQQAQTPPSRSEAELQEEEELQLAIALSQSEAESKDKNKRHSNSSFGSNKTSAPSTTYSAPTLSQPPPMIDTSDMDPELARYLDRNYWSQKHVQEDSKPASTQPSAPTANTSSEPKTSTVGVSEKYQNGEVNDEQQFLNALRSSIEIFLNRMKSNSARGRSIANDSSVQTLFLTLNTMHPQLLKYVNEQDEARAHFEGLQDKLAQLRDAREALDALREEHRLKKQREMEELERQRQIQMAHKLELLRIEKVKYLESQRQMMLQQMQEQERQMSMHLEKQKQMQQMRTMQVAGYPYQPQYGFPQPPQPGQGFSPAGSVEGSPHHQPGAPMPYMMGGGQPGVPPTVSSQPPYSQGVYTAPQPSHIYQAAPGYHVAGYQQPLPGQPGMPAATTQQGFAPMPQGQGEYSPYNMQGMSAALPGQGQQYMPGQQPMSMPPQGQAPQGQMAPPPQGQAPQGQMQPPPQGQAPQGQMPPPPQGQAPQGQMPPPPQGPAPPGQMAPPPQGQMAPQGQMQPPPQGQMQPQGQMPPNQMAPPQQGQMVPQGPMGGMPPPPGQPMASQGMGDQGVLPPSQEAQLISFD